MSPVSGLPAQRLVKKYPPNPEYPIKDWIKKKEETFSTVLHRVDKGTIWDKRHEIPRSKIDHVFSCEFVHPWSVFSLLHYQYGDEWKEWEPETISKTLLNDFDIETEGMIDNIIGALKGIIKKNSFWKDYRVFGWTSIAWNNHVPRFDVIPKPFPGYVLDVMQSVSWLYSDIYRPEIKNYSREILKDSGVGAPLSLKIVERPQSTLVKEYLQGKNDEILEEILDEAQDENDYYALKTIGMIDYHAARIQSLYNQMKQLFGGYVLDGIESTT